MKRATVPANMHYSLNFMNFKPYFLKKENDFLKAFYKIQFTIESTYIIDKDQSDINKLFGFSYGMHHKQSDRIGWRYNPDSDDISLFLYTYENGVRCKCFLTNVKLYEYYYILLDVDIKDKYRYVYIKISNTNRDIKYENLFNLKHIPKCWGYTLGLYFGGNRTVEYPIRINIEK